MRVGRASSRAARAYGGQSINRLSRMRSEAGPHWARAARPEPCPTSAGLAGGISKWFCWREARQHVTTCFRHPAGRTDLVRRGLQRAHGIAECRWGERPREPRGPTVATQSIDFRECARRQDHAGRARLVRSLAPPALGSRAAFRNGSAGGKRGSTLFKKCEECPKTPRSFVVRLKLIN
jgi:hypothetical protein